MWIYEWIWHSVSVALKITGKSVYEEGSRDGAGPLGNL